MPDLIERDAAIKLIQPRVNPKTVYGEGYLNAIEHITELLTLMPSANLWIPCSERLPDSHAKVLFVSFGKSVWFGKYCGIRNGHKTWETSKFATPFWDDEVTHWMPVPDAPAEEKPPQNVGR